MLKKLLENLATYIQKKPSFLLQYKFYQGIKKNDHNKFDFQ